MDGQTSNPAGSPKLTDTTPQRDGSPDEFNSFEKLTRKLVNVPKADLDEKRKAGN